MTPGTRHYHRATLTVAIPTALPDRMQSRLRELIDVYVPESHRRCGLASELLNRTIQEADRARMTLMLTIDDPTLEAFYARFGFQTIQRSPILMVRAHKGLLQ